MSKKLPRYIKSTLNQIEWYTEQLTYIHNLPVKRLNSKLLRMREHYTREINLLTKEIENDYAINE